MITFTFQGEPKAVQSARFARIGNFIKSYQPKDVIDWKNYVKIQAQAQLPEDFEMFKDCPLSIFAEFTFLPPKSMSKKDIKRIAEGELIYKITKPDLTDNLMKGLIDALSGIIWERDQQIALVRSFKRYSFTAQTILSVGRAI